MREFLLLPIIATISALVVVIALPAIAAILAYGELRGVVRLGGFSRLEE